MKKRIVASTMFSVMALGNAASAMVASAKVDDFKTEYVTKKTLEKYIADNDIQNLLNGDIEKYSTVAAEEFEKAIEYAEALIDEDNNPTSDECTVAYQMIKAAQAKLIEHSLEELQGLIFECEPIYANGEGNKLNERGDERYESGWGDFEDAYDEAEDAVRTEDPHDITEAYDKLDKAKKALKLAKIRNKSQINKAKKAYEDLVKLEYKYQPWARGKVSGSGTKYDDKTFAWGTLYAHIFSGASDLLDEYEEFVAIKGLNETSDPDIVAAVDAMEAAVKVLNGFESTFENKRKDTDIDTLLAGYQGRLVYEYNTALAAAIASNAATVAGGADKIEFLRSNGAYISADTVSVTAASASAYWNRIADKSNSAKTVSASLDIRVKQDAGTDLYYILDSNTKLANKKSAILGIGGTYFYATQAAAAAAAQTAGQPATNVKVMKHGKDVLTISDFIGVTADEVIATMVKAGDVTVSITGVAALNTAATSMVSLLTDASNAKGCVSSEVAKLVTALGSAKTAADISTTANYDDRNKSDMLEAIDTASTAVADLKAKVEAAKTVASLTPTQLTDVKDAYTNAKNQVEAMIAEYNSSYALTSYSDITGVSLASLNACFDTATTAFDALKDAFVGKYNEEAGAQAASVTNVVGNNVYDELTNDTKAGAFNYADGKAAASSVFSFATYTSSRTPGSSVVAPSLGKAMVMLKNFKAKNWGEVRDIDNMLTFRDDKDMEGETVASDAWKLLYNYMSYALKDKFDASAGNTYTKKQVEDLIKKADELIDKTVETSIFEASHVALVQDRAGAKEWVKQANADDNKNKTNRYKDYITTYTVETKKYNTPDTYDSTAMYEELKESYDQLSNELAAFEYSFDEIVKYMSNIAKRLDNKDFSDKAAVTVKEALEAASLALLNVGELTVSASTGSDIGQLNDTGLFNDDGTWNHNNRLFTKGAEYNGVVTERDNEGGVTGKAKILRSNTEDNGNHEAMTTAYKNLVKAVTDADKAATEQPKLELDLNGDGKTTIADAGNFLTLYIGGARDVAKYDYNNDGVVDMKDVGALLGIALNA